MIEIRHLKLLCTVAEVGSLKNAAEKLFLSQSALSHQLRELEQYLQTPIFYRLNKQLVFTPAGKVLLDASKEILSKLKSTEANIQQIMDGTKGTLRIMVECYTAYHWLPMLMKEFGQEFPKVDFTIVFDGNQNPVEQLIKGELDIAILSEYELGNPLVKAEKIFDDQLKVVLPAQHRLASKPYLEAEDFEDMHLLIHSLPLETVTLASKVLIPEKINLRKVTEVPITDAAVEMVKSHIGITTMPQWIFNAYEDDPDIVGIPVTERGVKVSWFAALLKEADRPAYFDAFLDKMLHLARPSIENRLHENYS
ncbi:MAG: LysR family transcriptional regulator [Cyclobacteriaceae bacterium]